MQFVAFVLVFLETRLRGRQRQLFKLAPLLRELHNVIDLVHFALFSLQQLGACWKQTQRIARHGSRKATSKPAIRFANVLAAIDVARPESTARTEPRSLFSTQKPKRTVGSSVRGGSTQQK